MTLWTRRIQRINDNEDNRYISTTHTQQLGYGDKVICHFAQNKIIIDDKPVHYRTGQVSLYFHTYQAQRRPHTGARRRPKLIT